MWFNKKPNKEKTTHNCTTCLHERDVIEEAVIRIFLGTSTKVDMCNKCLNEYIGILKEDTTRIQQITSMEVLNDN